MHCPQMQNGSTLAGQVQDHLFPGEEVGPDDANWNHGNDANKTVDVGSYFPNAWGFYDMHGNLWEWTADLYTELSDDPQTDPFIDGDTGKKVVRGGAYDAPSENLRSSIRGSHNPAQAFTNTGFRLSLKYTNQPPFELNSTAPLAIAENQPAGTIVGEFNATDPEGGVITYSMKSGDGFTMEENGTLKTSLPFDYETGSFHNIVVQAKDELNATVEGDFTVTITNVNEAPLMGGTVNLSISESENLLTIQTTWDRTFGGSGWDNFNEMIPTNDGVLIRR